MRTHWPKPPVYLRGKALSRLEILLRSARSLFSPSWTHNLATSPFSDHEHKRARSHCPCHRGITDRDSSAAQHRLYAILSLCARGWHCHKDRGPCYQICEYFCDTGSISLALAPGCLWEMLPGQTGRGQCQIKFVALCSAIVEERLCTVVDPLQYLVRIVERRYFR